MARRGSAVSRETKAPRKGRKAASKAPDPGKIRDRVVALHRVKAGELRAHEGNPRRHPQVQVDAVSALLREVGYAGALLAYRDGDALALFDGHLRQSLDDEQVVPVLETDLTPDEARLMLVLGDHTAGMAEVDPAAMLEQAAAAEPTDAELVAVLADVEAEAGVMAELEHDLEGSPGSAGRGAGGGGGGRDKWAAQVVRVVVAVDDLGPIEAALDVAGGDTRGQALTRICREWIEANAEAQRDG